MSDSDSDKALKVLKDLPSDTQAAIAMRAALRVLPMLDTLDIDQPSLQRFAALIFYCNRTTHLTLSQNRKTSAALDTARDALDAAFAPHNDARNAALAARNAALAILTVLSSLTALFSPLDAGRAATRNARVAARAAIDTFNVQPSYDIRLIRPHETSLTDVPELLMQPLWQTTGMPDALHASWTDLQERLNALDMDFDIWIDWYEKRLAGNHPIDFELEAKLLLSEERLSQSAAEINAHLKSILRGTSERQLNRVRAIFIGAGGAGKTSLINVLHGQPIPQEHDITKGIAVQDSSHKLTQSATPEHDANVYTRITDYQDQDPTVHFWDFGGQVMAHATHQFFMRARCLYVIVLRVRPVNYS